MGESFRGRPRRVHGISLLLLAIVVGAVSIVAAVAGDLAAAGWCALAAVAAAAAGIALRRAGGWWVRLADEPADYPWWHVRWTEEPDISAPPLPTLVGGRDLRVPRYVTPQVEAVGARLRAQGEGFLRAVAWLGEDSGIDRVHEAELMGTITPMLAEIDRSALSGTRRHADMLQRVERLVRLHAGESSRAVLRAAGGLVSDPGLERAITRATRSLEMSGLRKDDDERP